MMTIDERYLTSNTMKAIVHDMHEAASSDLESHRHRINNLSSEVVELNRRLSKAKEIISGLEQVADKLKAMMYENNRHSDQQRRLEACESQLDVLMTTVNDNL